MNVWYVVDCCRDTKVTVDRYSEPHYFNGFQWQLVLQVLEPPAKAPAAGQGSGQAAAAAAVDVFVGTTARIQVCRLLATMGMQEGCWRSLYSPLPIQ